jgi:hypothetical protein
MTGTRWRATVYYRADHGTVDVTHELEELADLHKLVERGPHWDSIERIEIVRINHVTSEALTVEAATDL